MIIKKLLAIYIFLNVHTFYAQLKGSTYQFPEKFSINYFFDPNLSYQKIKNVQVPGFTADQMNYYKIQKTYNTQRDFDNNSFYLEWYDLEKYLYKIIDTVLPKEIKTKQPYDVFIKRDIDYNASALGNGFVYANIGLIANCSTEAELAYVLGHEIGHSIFNHGYMINSDLVSSYNRNDDNGIMDSYSKIFNKSQYAELQSDSFAYECLNKASFNLKAVKKSLDLIAYTEFTSQFYVKKSDRISYGNYLNTFSTHPSFYKRNKLLTDFILDKNDKGKSYLIDSIYFNKVRKIAREECKKISMEEGDYVSIMKASFIDYLQGDNSLKNLYYLFESMRRFLYAHPEYADKGFLGEDFQFTEFKNMNASILEKPELLFNDSLSYKKASNHILIIQKEKPFNTYEQAYLYFVKLAEEKGFNEARFSQSLFYFSKKNELKFKEYISIYLEKGGGLYTDFANNLMQFGFPYIKEGKTNILIDNSTNYSSSDNYYHSLLRIKSNQSIKDIFAKDSSKMKLTMMNELLGVKPRELYNYQKLKWNIGQLYNETDEEKFYKLRYLKKEIMDERDVRNKYNKNLMIFVPEWFNWFNENKFNGVLIQNIMYEYAFVTDENEYHNLYSLQYFNFFDNRPFFGKCARTATLRKQTNIQMAQDVEEYLFKKE